MGFVIGIRPVSTRQSYKAFRFGAKNEVIPITNDNGMPHRMKAWADIEQGDFWPRSSGDGAIYLASTYDEATFALVHVVRGYNDLALYIKNLTEDMTRMTDWRRESNPRVYPMNEEIGVFKGFIKIAKASGPSDILAFVYLGQMTFAILLDFDLVYNKNFQTQRYFLLQVFIGFYVNYSNRVL